MERTLWELAQSFRALAASRKGFGSLEGDCWADGLERAAKHLEHWAREKAKEYGDSFEIAEEGLFIPLHRIESDLGVPDEESR